MIVSVRIVMAKVPKFCASHSGLPARAQASSGHRMAAKPTLPPFAAIIVAAGKGLRAGQPLPKQFVRWRGKPVLRHSVEAFAAAGASPIVIAIPASAEEIAREAIGEIKGVHFVEGGVTRQDSVRIALEMLEKHNPRLALIHDAARPMLPFSVIHRLIDILEHHSGAIPVLPVVDSLVVEQNGMMAGSAEREKLRRVQTPQGFHFDPIMKAHKAWTGATDAGDDAQVFIANGQQVALVKGSEDLKKLTYSNDFKEQSTFSSVEPPIRSGIGYDVHRLGEGEELWLGGIKIEHDRGLIGHSDADVALHAIVDALLGAIGAGDIGDHFPPSDPQWRGVASARFVEHGAALVRQSGYAIGNIDCTIICEAPRIGPHRAAMRQKIAELLGVQSSLVSVKATTTERLGFAGRGEGIAAQAIATVYSESFVS